MVAISLLEKTTRQQMTIFYMSQTLSQGYSHPNQKLSFISNITKSDLDHYCIFIWSFIINGLCIFLCSFLQGVATCFNLQSFLLNSFNSPSMLPIHLNSIEGPLFQVSGTVITKRNFFLREFTFYCLLSLAFRSFTVFQVVLNFYVAKSIKFSFWGFFLYLQCLANVFSH